MMPKIFVDTSAWYAIADPSDNNHQSALLYRNQIAKKYHLVISNYILDELYTLLLIHVNYNRAIEMKRKLDILEKRKILEVVWIDEKMNIFYPVIVGWVQNPSDQIYSLFLKYSAIASVILSSILYILGLGFSEWSLSR
jgi:predicted nucleic acid-binding protein